ncbi:hypothetical protein COY95_01565, partial [Candidatus Woesearchaeota archaeon CG_4_10_14_0_8_um_filter_47_5]
KETVFFLTSRHTQHRIALDTINKIKEKFSLNFVAVDIIGKKWMCLVPEVSSMYTSEFHEFCKKQVEEYTCPFYVGVKNRQGKITEQAEHELADFGNMGSLHAEELKERCTQKNMCPYYLSIELAKKAKVIIADYYYLFHPRIRASFLNSLKKELSEIIIIIDEGHNLPGRIRETMSFYLTNTMLQRAEKEAQKFNFKETASYLKEIQAVIGGLVSGNEGSRAGSGESIKDRQSMNDRQSIKSRQGIGGLGISKYRENERYISKEEVVRAIEKQLDDYEEVVADLMFIGEDVRDKQKQSYIGSVAEFLDAWSGDDEGYARILRREQDTFRRWSLSYRCLDPSLTAREVIDASRTVIMMSGTLSPPEMYQELLGFGERGSSEEFPSPFPEENRLALVVPKTTTRYVQRSPEQFKSIAAVCTEITDAVPGNSVLFFPSYQVMQDVSYYFTKDNKRIVFQEQPHFTKEQKEELLAGFKKYALSGAVLLATIGGSFSEGIDLPGDLLKCVVVVGLPLVPPDLETKSLVAYYNAKFGKGEYYGYIFPAMNKAIQAAGRCIRDETDRGVIVFLDHRYTWPRYFQCFPSDWNLTITRDYLPKIKHFFSKNTSN